MMLQCSGQCFDTNGKWKDSAGKIYGQEWYAETSNPCHAAAHAGMPTTTTTTTTNSNSNSNSNTTTTTTTPTTTTLLPQQQQQLLLLLQLQLIITLRFMATKEWYDYI